MAVFGIPDETAVALYLTIGFCAYLLSWWFMWRYVAPRAGDMAQARAQKYWTGLDSLPVKNELSDKAAMIVSAKIQPIISQIEAKISLFEVKTTTETSRMTESLSKLQGEIILRVDSLAAKLDKFDSKSAIENVEKLRGELTATFTAIRDQVREQIETVRGDVRSTASQVNGALGQVTRQSKDAADAVGAAAAQQVGNEIKDLSLEQQLRLRTLKLAAAYRDNPKASPWEKEAGEFAAQLLASGVDVTGRRPIGSSTSGGGSLRLGV